MVSQSDIDNFMDTGGKLEQIANILLTPEQKSKFNLITRKQNNTSYYLELVSNTFSTDHNIHIHILYNGSKWIWQLTCRNPNFNLAYYHQVDLDRKGHENFNTKGDFNMNIFVYSNDDNNDFFKLLMRMIQLLEECFNSYNQNNPLLGRTESDSRVIITDKDGVPRTYSGRRRTPYKNQVSARGDVISREPTSLSLGSIPLKSRIKKPNKSYGNLQKNARLILQKQQDGQGKKKKKKKQQTKKRKPFKKKKQTKKRKPFKKKKKQTKQKKKKQTKQKKKHGGGPKKEEYKQKKLENAKKRLATAKSMFKKSNSSSLNLEKIAPDLQEKIAKNLNKIQEQEKEEYRKEAEEEEKDEKEQKKLKYYGEKYGMSAFTPGWENLPDSPEYAPQSPSYAPPSPDYYGTDDAINQ